MLDIQTIESLKSYFAPKPQIVNSLPSGKTVSDFTMVVLKEAATKKLYIMVEGEWKLVTTLT